MRASVSNNITKLYFIKIAKWFMLTMPVIVPFYELHHLTGRDVLLLQAVYSISTLVMEIPSGYFADVWGRKKSLILGSILGVLGFSIYCLPGSFYTFLVAELILGLGQSFISGSDSALLYDSLVIMKKENHYMKYEGKMSSIGNFAEAIAGILAGFLAVISLQTNFYVQTIISMIAVPAAFLLVEPDTHKMHLSSSFSAIIKTVKFSLFENKLIRWNILYSSIIGTSTLTMAWFAQFFFKEITIPIEYYGILWTALNTVVGLTSLVAYRFERFLGMKQTVLFIWLIITASYVLIGFFPSPYALAILFVFYMIRGIATPVLKDYINRITSSENRATILSIRNFVIRIFFSLAGPFLGWVNDLYSFSSAMLIAGLIFGTISLVFAFLFIVASSSAKKDG